jgi:dephospho-CoA kinase
MLKIGITGGIGSGKTTVCKLFELLSIPVFYADEVAKNIMYTDEKLKQNLIQRFSANAYDSKGQLNRRYIADIVFNDAEELKALNGLVHPAVFSAFDNWYRMQSGPYIIKEAALLFESESYKKCDYNILVSAPNLLKLNRVMERDHVSAHEVELRMAKQFTDEQKQKLADFMLVNDESQLLIPQVLNLHKKLSAFITKP